MFVVFISTNHSLSPSQKVSAMYISFKTTMSAKVLGVSFHSRRPWILASLLRGGIELWDYRLGKLIQRFDEHDGPVHGVHFHRSRPLFVSGGDDFNLKVWEYETHKCPFSLLGHHGSIRTVEFHSYNPWILSASEDKTIRIWNWLSRTTLSVLTGHSDSVTCASFHPTDNLIVSASLDKTVRVWDIEASPSGGVHCMVKHVLSGHAKGVNSASFHPKVPLIVSGANDHQVKLWRMDGTPRNTLKGHCDNVTSVLYQRRRSSIVSTSEDGSIYVWDGASGAERRSFRLKYRFSILAAHPEMNLLAAGHDNGLMVFKFERERPAFDVYENSLFFAKDHFLWVYHFLSQALAPSIDHASTTTWNPSVRTVSWSRGVKAVLTSTDLNGGSYSIYIYQSGKRRCETYNKESALFVSSDKYAVLQKSTNMVLIKNIDDGEILVEISLHPDIIDAIFYAGTGNLLCRSGEKVVFLDLHQELVLCELRTPAVVRYVVWSSDMEWVALLSKHTITIASKKLVIQCTLNETKRVKSGAWDDENGVLIYTTLDHIKYCLPNGENGIIQTIDVPLYVTKVSRNRVFCLDREVRIRIIQIDATDYIFKLSMLRKNYSMRIDGSQLCGQAIVAYLQQHGLPELALPLAEDDSIRFNLAIESGNIDEALGSAEKINEKSQWHKLGVEALRQGNTEIAIYAHEQAKNVEQLSFLHLITGNMEKLKTVDVKDNVMSQFRNALYLGDVTERVKILENAGQLPLAYITASVHGLGDVAERLASELGDEVPSLPEGKTPSLLLPPIPCIRGKKWPTILKASELGDEVPLLPEGKTPSLLLPSIPYIRRKNWPIIPK